MNINTLQIIIVYIKKTYFTFLSKKNHSITQAAFHDIKVNVRNKHTNYQFPMSHKRNVLLTIHYIIFFLCCLLFVVFVCFFLLPLSEANTKLKRYGVTRIINRS